ncbi:MAG TPA: ATP-dependent DNA helicase RecG [bacterium]|nr:ATP-dependent DNA helicase RecG [bacterium]
METGLESVARRIARPLEALERSGYALADRMPDLGARLLGWLDELESDSDALGRCRDLVLGLDSLPADRRADRLRKFTREWREYLKQKACPKPSEPPLPKDGWSVDDLAGRPLLYEKGVGPARYERLKRLGLFTVDDLFACEPRGYQDRSRLVPLDRLRAGEEVTVVGELRSVELIRGFRGRKPRLSAILTGEGGSLVLTWFNALYLAEKLRPGRRLVAFGKVSPQDGGALINPDFEFLDAGEDPLAFGRIVPTYGLTEGLGQRYLRTLVRRVLDRYLPKLQDHVPEEVWAPRGLPGLAEAFEHLHYPPDLDAPERARRRLAFDGLFLLQLAVLRERMRLDKTSGGRIEAGGELVRRALDKLGFELTGAQKRVLERIRHDLAQSRPMNRLLQGDVGSGKTVVALLAMLLAVEAGWQAALMAPTEVLARQHHRTFRRVLDPLGVPCHLVTGGVKDRARRPALEAIAAGEPGVTIGTTALIQEGVVFPRLGLAVVDEQHRFGVAQRGRLCPPSTNVLVMTATPIPRSLALTVYGDLDSSVIDELPPGRRPVETRWLSGRNAREAFDFIREEAARGRQAFVVCPLVEESLEKGLAAATARYDELREGPLAELRLGLVHGRLDSLEKERTMRSFATGKLDVLVATTVVEVGIDVPNATVMVVEEAQQFGLSQLHQLRGRVARSPHSARCYLVSGRGLTDAAKRRLRAMTETDDGFRLAELDLELRGPGELLGTRQHGLPDVALATLVTDRRMLEEAREAARRLLEDDPELEKHPRLKRRLESVYGSGDLGVVA